MGGINKSAISRVFASVDWGFTNPGVMQIWIVDGDGRMYMIRETYMTGKTIDWWVQRGKEMKEQYGPSMFVCDPSEPAYIRQFIKGGLPAVGGNNRVLPGINAVKERLQLQADGRPRLYIVRDCLVEVDTSLVEANQPYSTAQEIDGYLWKDKSTKEEPVKENDHGMDCMRYAVSYMTGTGWARGAAA